MTLKTFKLSLTLFFIVILMFVITFIPIQAYTYNDPVANQGVIDIDTGLTILNNWSLREIFEDGNIYNYNIVAGSIEELQHEYRIFNVEAFTRIEANTLLAPQDEYYISFDTYFNDSISDLIIQYNGGVTASFAYNINQWTNIQFRWISTNNTVVAPYYYDGGPLNNQFLLLKNALLLNLDDFGITNLSNVQIDYFYQLYQILRLGLDPTLYYQQGLGVGYGNGFDDGYHDGYDDGNEFGYNQGFNEGSDYMATNNISLLSIFEVLIGIMMSFVGFIINIELFGISIASVLAMLGIGIVIIWTLKLIRG
jgi:hypothetical protein